MTIAPQAPITTADAARALADALTGHDPILRALMGAKADSVFFQWGLSPGALPDGQLTLIIDEFSIMDDDEAIGNSLEDDVERTDAQAQILHAGMEGFLDDIEEAMNVFHTAFNKQDDHNLWYVLHFTTENKVFAPNISIHRGDRHKRVLHHRLLSADAFVTEALRVEQILAND